MFIRVMYCCLTLGLYFKEKNLKVGLFLTSLVIQCLLGREKQRRICRGGTVVDGYVLFFLLVTSIF